MYLADGRWERVLVRRVPAPREFDEVEREQLAHIVESSVDALLSGATIGLTLREVSRSLRLPDYGESTGGVPETDASGVRDTRRHALSWGATLRYEEQFWSPAPAASSALAVSLELWPVPAAPPAPLGPSSSAL